MNKEVPLIISGLEAETNNYEIYDERNNHANIKNLITNHNFVRSIVHRAHDSNL
jgi:hypothetical protein